MARMQNRPKRLRRRFGRIREISRLPDLLAIQRHSYEFFLNSGEGDEHQRGMGLQGAFDSVFPIRNPDRSAELKFLRYEVGVPQYDAEECRMRDLTYGAPLKATFRLDTYDVDGDTGHHVFKHSKEQTVHMGDLPMMTDTGTFVVNGAERVVVSQLHRSPGVYFDHDGGKKSASGKPRYLARIIPYRGSWLEFEFDTRDRIHFKVDRDLKLPMTTLFYAFGMNREEICRELYPARLYRRCWERGWTEDSWTLLGRRLHADVLDADSRKVVAKADDRVTRSLGAGLDGDGVKRLANAETGEAILDAGEGGWSGQEPDSWSLLGGELDFDLIDAETGEIAARKGERLTRKLVRELEAREGLNRLLNAVTGEVFASRRRFWSTVVDLAVWRGRSPESDLVSADTGEVVVARGVRITERMASRFGRGGFRRRVESEELLGRPSARDIVDPSTGVVLVDAAAFVTLEALESPELDEIEVLELPEGGGFTHAMIAQELLEESRQRLPSGDDRELALYDIYRHTRSSEAPSLATAEDLFDGLFLDSSRYDLSAVGRAKIRERLGVGAYESECSLCREDVVAVARELESLLLNSRGRQHERATERNLEGAARSKIAEWRDGAGEGAAKLPEKSLVALIRELEQRFDLTGVDGFARARIDERLGRNVPAGERVLLRAAGSLFEAGRGRSTLEWRDRLERIAAVAREAERRFKIPGIVAALEHRIEMPPKPGAEGEGELSEDDAVAAVLEDIRGRVEDGSLKAESTPDEEEVEAFLRGEFNRLLGRWEPAGRRALDEEDALAILADLPPSSRRVDDIDHLGNRRVRSVGELIEQQYRFGLMRMERAVRERIKRITPAELEQLKPEDLINARAVVGAVKEFLASSQLSQFMDQTNPLSEMAHKRRISALGPRGLKRRNAGFEVRDVHRTHYGRICPIETPEGANIGLVNSFATFAKVNRLGFIETPFRRVEKGRVTDSEVYLTAIDEIGMRIAQANEPLARNGRLQDEVLTRSDSGHGEVFEKSSRDKVDLIDVSPKQVVSVSASLIPFLENDDANRALMGSNMQRQAVPLIETEAPFVGTGIEDKVARDCKSAVTAERDGVVDRVDAERIVVRATGALEPGDLGVNHYRLQKFQRSNQNTAINQRPLVKKGEKVLAGEVIADGPSTDRGELALGRNVLVAFMPWQGYNFEDSVLVSERVVHEDVFTSINIERYEIAVRDTKLGPEAVTRELPNVGEEMLRNLDEAGIVYIGAQVKAGDILVGKVTPKGETPMTPEEKLLRAIFGEKAAEARDTSLKLPPGDEGTVVEVRVFTRENVEPDQRARQIAEHMMQKFERERLDEQKIHRRNIDARLRDLLAGQTASRDLPDLGVGKGAILKAAALAGLDRDALFQLAVEDAGVMARMERLHEEYEARARLTEEKFADRCIKVQRSDNLQAGVIKIVKVFVAVKRKLQPGDKMAGRHGNKGVISRVLPVEDMPFLADGTPVDVLLNPLGVPSRMNVGLFLETHLGWAAHGLGRMVGRALDAYRSGGGARELRRIMGEVYGRGELQEAAPGDDALADLAEQARCGVHFATPVFDGARAEDIRGLLEKAGLDSSGQEVLFDGRTGQPFDRRVTVGYKYMMKLHHLVDNKIHARSTGPYSLVTQQPVRGKARFGGQRVGEMEVWALQAYGAAHTLREILTYKSDDVAGRAKAYEAMAKGEGGFEAGRPESFNVLVNELKALGLNVQLLSDEAPEEVEAESPPPPLPARLTV